MAQKKFYLLPTGVVLFWAGELFACGPMSTTGSYLFSQQNPTKEFCSASGWDSDYLYSSQVVSSQTPSLCSDGDANVLSWAAYAKQSKQADIAQVLNEFTSAKMKPGSLKASKNAFAQFLSSSGGAQARDLLAFAKEVEVFTASVSSAAVDRPWDWKPAGINTPLAKRLTDLGEKSFATAKDSSIKERYALQLIRIRFYTGDFQVLIKDYERFGMEKAQTTPVKMMAKRYLAGALIRTGQKELAAIHLAELFVSSPDLSAGAADDFRRLGEVNEEKLIGQTQSSAIRAGIYLLKATHNPSYSLPFLKKAYEIEPSQPLIGRLLLREVAMLEENNVEILLGHEKPQTTSLQDRIEQAIENFVYRVRNAAASLFGRPALAKSLIQGTEKDHAVQLATWADKVIQDGKRTDLDLWRFNSAYLHFLSGDLDQTLAITKTLSNRKYWGDKARALSFLSTVTLADKIEPRHEAEFLALKDILYPVKSDEESNLHPLRDFTFQLLSRKYRAQNDLAHSVLMDAMQQPLSDGEYIDQLGNAESVPVFLAMLEKKDQSAFEKFGIKKSLVQVDDIRDHLGSLYLREEKYKEALAEFQKLPAKYVKNLNKSYVLQAGPLGLETVDARSDKEPDWDKKLFAEAMVRLSDATAKNPTPELLQQLANAQFNMTHFGRWWILTRRFKSAGNHYDFDSRLLKNSKQNAEKILTITKDRETSARAAYLLALIGDGELYFSGAQSDYSPLPANSKEKRPLYARLGGYSDTEFYKDYILNCPEFRSFIGF
ncbi:MAG: hypothetical protein K8S54_14675 [Spirochaetia bacterium]|nr:hypothetical protein [Spirochaetia bacterium]